MSKRRDKGDGSIYKRDSDGLWVGNITIGRDQQGKRIRKVAYGKTRAECVAKLNELKKIDFASHAYLDSDKITLSDWLDSWMTAKSSQLAPSTVDSYQRVIDVYIKPFLGNTKLIQLNAVHLRKRLSEMESGGLSLRTREYVYSILNQALKQAVIEDILAKNCCMQVAKPRPQPKVIQVPTPEEVGKILSHTTDRFSLIFWIAWETGMRRGEILALTWRDIDRKNKTISVSKAVYYKDGQTLLKPPKNSSSNRTIPVSKELIDKLTASQDNIAGPLFTRLDGQLFIPNLVSKAFEKAVKLAGLSEKGFTFHHLRHAHAHALLKEKVPMEVVQHRLGHSTIQMTIDLYGHINTGFQAEIPAIMDKLRGLM